MERIEPFSPNGPEKTENKGSKTGRLGGKEVKKITEKENIDVSNTLKNLSSVSKSSKPIRKAKDITEIESKADALIKLLPKSERIENAITIKETVKFIENYKDAIITKAKDSENGVVFIRPQDFGGEKKEFFNIVVMINKSGAETIFIHPKAETLGTGMAKKVTVGMDYTHNKRKAIAVIKDKDEIKKAHREFTLQKKFEVADISCTYRLGSTDNKHERERMLLIMPEANHGDIQTWFYGDEERKIPEHSFQELTADQRKQIVSKFFQFLIKCHDVEIAFSDVKPENILLHQEGDVFEIMLNDFGLAFDINDPLANLGAGTRLFTAPEVASVKDELVELENRKNEYFETLDELKNYEEGSENYIETKEEADELLNEIHTQHVSLNLKQERDVYAAGMTLAFILQQSYPPWIARSLSGINASGELTDDPENAVDLIINRDVYSKNFPAFVKYLTKDSKLEDIIYKMTNPDPDERYTMKEAFVLLEEVDWENDPLIKNASFW